MLMLISRGKLLLKKDFIRNSITLLLGTGFSQFVTLLFSPLLTRMYSPFEFGKLALFMSTCAILSIVSTGRYELAIMLPKKDIRAFNVFINVLLLALFINLLFLIFFIIFGEDLLSLFNNPFELRILLFIPLGTFLNACLQALTFWYNRKKKYKAISILKISQSIVTIFLSILAVSLNFDKNALIFSYIVGLFLTIIPLIYVAKYNSDFYSKSYIINGFKKYLSYPVLMMPAAFMDNFAMQAPVFFITKYFTSIIVGAYSLAFRVVTAPIGIISAAIGQVYLQKITSNNNQIKSSTYSIFIGTAKILVSISLLIFTPLFFFGRNIFEFIFGINWIRSGEFVEIVSIAMLVRFVVSPLSTIFISTSNLKIASLWQSIYFITTICLFYLCRNFDIKLLLSIYTIHEVIMYTIYFILMINVCKKFDNKLLCVD